MASSGTGEAGAAAGSGGDDVRSPREAAATGGDGNFGPMHSVESGGGSRPAGQSAPAAGSAEDELSSGTLGKLDELLPRIVKEAGHSEMWGVDMTGMQDAPCCIVLQKFLRANNDKVERAADQLKKALVWRREFNPLGTVTETHDIDKFAGLGFVTLNRPSDDVDDAPPTVVTWNIYGGVKDRKKTFGDVDEFCRWRVALMEMGIRGLKLNEALAPIPESGEDQYRMVQVHDYMGLSFLRVDPEIKAASKKVVEIFQTAYPELLEHKYFVNVPYFMNWLYGFFKIFLSKETVAKFHPLSQGTMLAGELPLVAHSLPAAYGGRGPALTDDESAAGPRLGVRADEAAAEGSGARKEEPKAEASSLQAPAAPSGRQDAEQSGAKES